MTSLADPNPYKTPAAGEQLSAPLPDLPQGNLAVQGIRVGGKLGAGISLLMVAVPVTVGLVERLFGSSWYFHSWSFDAPVFFILLLTPPAVCILIGGATGLVAMLEERLRGRSNV